jgi:RNA polymerase sigma factor (sigma-70 family)
MAADVRLHRMRLVAASADSAEAARDLELARALIDGARNAPELAWERYAPLVHRIVSRAIGPDAEVEDVTQEIFYRLFSRIGTLRKPEALRSFVISFAIRIVKWELRRRRARRWLTLSETGDVPDEQLMVMDAESRYSLHRLIGFLGIDAEINCNVDRFVEFGSRVILDDLERVANRVKLGAVDRAHQRLVAFRKVCHITPPRLRRPCCARCRRWS